MAVPLKGQRQKDPEASGHADGRDEGARLSTKMSMNMAYCGDGCATSAGETAIQWTKESTLMTFDPIKYKETTRDQWQAAAEAWHRWGPTLSTWLGPAMELMLDMAGI